MKDLVEQYIAQNSNMKYILQNCSGTYRGMTRGGEGLNYSARVVAIVLYMIRSGYFLIISNGGMHEQRPKRIKLFYLRFERV